MARKLSLTKKRQKLFLEHLEKSGNVSAAARVCGVGRTQLYARRKNDVVFRTLWVDAEMDFLSRAEQVLLARAVQGQERVKVRVKTDGSTDANVLERVEETVTEFSDQNLRFYLSNRHPGYRDGEMPNIAPEIVEAMGGVEAMKSAFDFKNLTSDEALMLSQLMDKAARATE